MIQTKSKFAIAAAVVMALVGCGGSDSNIDTNASSRLVFSSGDSYNGTTSDFRAGSATTTTVGGGTVATISQGSRTIVVTLPGNTFAAGDTFDIGSGEARAVYTEVSPTDGSTATWVATDGNVTINATIGGISANVSLDSVKFTNDSSIESNTATGTFLLSGNVVGITFAGSGSLGGTADFAFSGQEGTNANTTVFGDSKLVYGTVGTNSTLFATVGRSSDRRSISVLLSPDATAGSTITLGSDVNQAKVVFTQGAGGTAKVWRATSGSIHVVSRNATQVKVQLIGVTFTSTNSDANGATGTFIVNGTINKI